MISSKKLAWVFAIIMMAGWMSSCAVRDCGGRKKHYHPNGFWMQAEPDKVETTNI